MVGRLADTKVCGPLVGKHTVALSRGAGASAIVRKMLLVWLSAVLASIAIGQHALGADDLKLRANVSFTQDLDNGFPITGTEMDDCKVSTTTPTFIFFGASGDLNTNRQAKRLVDLYKKISTRSIKYIVIDVDHPPNDDAKSLIKSYYHGYIPSEVLLDKSGKQAWSHDGEADFAAVKNQVEKYVD